MKCIIVDDEPIAREGIELKVLKVPFLKLVGQFYNALDANAFLAANEVDLMFLDIQMPDLTGLELLKSLKNPPLVIFTTAYSEYALEGFELDAADYLLKPITFNRFLKAVNKAKEVYDLHQKNKNTVEAISDEFIYIKADRQYIRLFFKDIRYIEGMRNYVIIHTQKEKIMPAINVKQIYDRLPKTIFARVSKSYIINVNYINRILTDFVMIGDAEIPLGKTYKEHFIQRHVKKRLLNK